MLDAAITGDVNAIQVLASSGVDLTGICCPGEYVYSFTMQCIF